MIVVVASFFFFFFHDVSELGDLDKLAKQKSKAILFFLMKQDALYFFHTCCPFTLLRCHYDPGSCVQYSRVRTYSQIKSSHTAELTET